MVARALHRVGITTPEGLAVIADLWRGFEPQPKTTRQELFERNWDSLVQASEAQQKQEVDPEDARSVCHQWPFPLWPLDLKQKGPTKAELRRQRAEQIKWRRQRASERDPAPVVAREKVEELTKAHSDFKLEWERLIASLPENRDSGLRIVKGSVRSYGLESYECLRRMVGDLEVEELMDLAALGWFGRHPDYGWAYCHQHARRIISDASVGYVCGLGQHLDERVEALERAAATASEPDHWWGPSVAGTPVFRSTRHRSVSLYAAQVAEQLDGGSPVVGG